MKVLALDQATRTGWCFGSSTLPMPKWQSGHFKAPRRDEEGERLCIIEDSILELIDRFEPDLVAYEEPYDPSSDAIRAIQEGKQPRQGYDRKTMQFLQRVKGAVIMAAARRSIPTESYQPRSWRTVLKLPPKPYEAKHDWIKKQTMEAVRRLGATVETFDEADSFGIAIYALHGKAGIKRATADLFARARNGL